MLVELSNFFGAFFPNESNFHDECFERFARNIEFKTFSITTVRFFHAMNGCILKQFSFFSTSVING